MEINQKMTETKEKGEAPVNPELEANKLTFNMFQQKTRLLQTPTEEVQQLTDVIKQAAASDRMGKEEDFAEFVNSELAIGLM